MAGIQLAPMPQQIGVFDNFIARQTETLVLREKVLSLTGDNFEIKLANGQPILKVSGKVMSISGRKSVFDVSFVLGVTASGPCHRGNRPLQSQRPSPCRRTN
jgi:hypothetical protein